MRGFGTFLIIIGACAALYSCTMSVSIPGASVVNLHLMHERQMTMLVGIGMFIAGCVLAAIGGRKVADPSAATREDHIIAARDRKPLKQVVAERTGSAFRSPCPNCAESILRAAMVCPFCQRDLAEGWAAPKPAASAVTSAGPQNSGRAREIAAYVFGVAFVGIMGFGIVTALNDARPNETAATAPPPATVAAAQPNLNALAAIIMRADKPCRYAKAAEEPRGPSWRVVCADGEIYRIMFYERDGSPTVLRCVQPTC